MTDRKCYLSATIVASAVILLMDYIWLGLINGKTWNKQVRDIQGSNMKVRPLGAVVAYTLMIASILTFGVAKIGKKNLVRDSLITGALLGLFIYGVFDGTTYAIFKDYKMSIAISDILWGMFLMAIATLAATWAAHHWIWIK